jgi:hypothetical protein
MSLKYTTILHSKAFQTLPKLGFLAYKNTNWQPWLKGKTMDYINQASYAVCKRRQCNEKKHGH